MKAAETRKLTILACARKQRAQLWKARRAIRSCATEGWTFTDADVILTEAQIKRLESDGYKVKHGGPSYKDSTCNWVQRISWD